MRKLMCGSRGQSLIETVFVLPIVILLLFGIIYFSNLGTVAERTQTAVRYGAQIAFAGGSGTAYEVEAIYTAQESPSGSNCPTPPTSVLYHAAPFPTPTSAPYWNPSAATAGCNIVTAQLVGAQFLASRYITAGKVSVNATSTMPDFFQNVFTAGQTSGVEAWVHAAWPGVILACTQKTAPAVQQALTANGTATYGGKALQILPSPWPATCTQ